MCSRIINEEKILFEKIHLLNWSLGTNFSEISIDIQTFSFKKIHFKMSSGKWQPFCLGLNVLNRLKINMGLCNCLPPYWHLSITRTNDDPVPRGYIAWAGPSGCVCLQVKLTVFKEGFYHVLVVVCLFAIFLRSSPCPANNFWIFLKAKPHNYEINYIGFRSPMSYQTRIVCLDWEAWIYTG